MEGLCRVDQIALLVVLDSRLLRSLVRWFQCRIMFCCCPQWEEKCTSRWNRGLGDGMRIDMILWGRRTADGDVGRSRL